MKQTAENKPIVEMRNIKKHFGAVQALRGVDLALQHCNVSETIVPCNKMVHKESEPVRAHTRSLLTSFWILLEV